MRDECPVAVIIDIDTCKGVSSDGIVGEIVGGAAVVEEDAIGIILGDGVMVEVVTIGAVEKYSIVVVIESVKADVDVRVTLDESDAITSVISDDIVIDEMVV